MQQMLGGMTTAKPRISGMGVITSLDTASRSVSFAKAKTDSTKGAIPAQNQQLIRDIKSKVEPATKPIERKTQTIAGVLEPKEAAITRQEATNEPQYSDDLFTPAKPSADKVAAAKRLAALKIKAAKQAKQLAAIREAKQAKADKQWSAYLADKRAARQLRATRKSAEIAKKARDEAAWIAHIEAKRAARKAAQQAKIAAQKKVANEAWEQHLAAKRAAKKAAKQAEKSRKVVKHSKRESAVMPAPKLTTKKSANQQPKKRISKKQPTYTHSAGTKKPDAVTVCIESPVTGKEVCI